MASVYNIRHIGHHENFEYKITGYECDVFLLDGRKITLKGNSPEELEVRAKRLLKAYGPKFSFETRGRKMTGGRQANTKDLLRALGRVDLAVSGAAYVGHIQTLEEIAQKLINRVATDRTNRPNVYTGNLQRSYVASIIHNKSVVKRLMPSKRPNGSRVHRTERGARYAELAEVNHSVARFIYYNKKRGVRYRKPKFLEKNGNIIRYLRPWEIEGGYANRATVGYRNWSRMNLGVAQSNKGGIRSVVVLENTAPYADAVQRAHYRILQNAAAEGVVGDATLRQRQLIRVATNRMLKEAGFNIK